MLMNLFCVRPADHYVSILAGASEFYLKLSPAQRHDQLQKWCW